MDIWTIILYMIDTICVSCKVPLERRERDAHRKHYCSDICQSKYRLGVNRKCPVFDVPVSRGIHCSRKCSNISRKGEKRTGKVLNKSAQRLRTLKAAFDFTICMVSGCFYSKCFDVHRHIKGCEGGEYVIGNMFAICPNHHAEVTRKLIKFEKVNDQLLRAIEIGR
jgi:hypothetical protein